MMNAFREKRIEQEAHGNNIVNKYEIYKLDLDLLYQISMQGVNLIQELGLKSDKKLKDKQDCNISVTEMRL